MTPVLQKALEALTNAARAVLDHRYQMGAPMLPVHNDLEAALSKVKEAAIQQQPEPVANPSEKHFRERIDAYADRHPSLLVRQLATLLREQWRSSSLQQQEVPSKPTHECDYTAGQCHRRGCAQGCQAMKLCGQASPSPTHPKESEEGRSRGVPACDEAEAFAPGKFVTLPRPKPGFKWVVVPDGVVTGGEGQQ